MTKNLRLVTGAIGYIGSIVALSFASPAGPLALDVFLMILAVASLYLYSTGLR